MVAAPFDIIIPARYASTRYPAKPLAMLRGAGGEARSLIERSWRCAMAVEGVRAVWVATDDDRIADAVRKFGGEVILTSPDCPNGTERCAEAVMQIPDAPDIIVNLQGDAPLTPVHVVTALVSHLVAHPEMVMATPGVKCSRSLYQHLVNDQLHGRVGGTTVVTNSQGAALYFSKRVVPHLPPSAADRDFPPVKLHLGVYAYRRKGLDLYRSLPVSELEQLEGLEQLRFLDGGASIAVVEFEPMAWDVIELNNPEDVPSIEAILRQRGMD
jgi:3-deoxy-manno-octulosonate cytidylyltransferase (CMP-KDO synthetase)